MVVVVFPEEEPVKCSGDGAEELLLLEDSPEQGRVEL